MTPRRKGLMERRKGQQIGWEGLAIVRACVSGRESVGGSAVPCWSQPWA